MMKEEILKRLADIGWQIIVEPYYFKFEDTNRYIDIYNYYKGEKFSGYLKEDELILFSKLVEILSAEQEGF